MLKEIYEDAISRFRRKCSHKTCYSHENLQLWLQNALNNDGINQWKIMCPNFSKHQPVFPQLSSWPAEKIYLEVKDWLKVKQFNGDTTDFLDGLCEALALYFSNFISSSLKGETSLSLDLDELMKSALLNLVEKSAPDAAETVLLNHFLVGVNTPIVWGSEITGSYFDYLFGNDSTKLRIKMFAESTSVFKMPLYMLNYIFDGDELDNQHLTMENPPETAQYSLHAVGLVFDKNNRTVYVADANGPVIPGCNYEFVEIPVSRKSDKTSSTCVSCFDLDEQEKKKRKKRKLK